MGAILTFETFMFESSALHLLHMWQERGHRGFIMPFEHYASGHTMYRVILL